MINNAGHQKTNGSILDISTEDFDRTMKTNIYAPFWIYCEKINKHNYLLQGKRELFDSYDLKINALHA